MTPLAALVFLVGAFAGSVAPATAADSAFTVDGFCMGQAYRRGAQVWGAFCRSRDLPAAGFENRFAFDLSANPGHPEAALREANGWAVVRVCGELKPQRMSVAIEGWGSFALHPTNAAVRNRFLRSEACEEIWQRVEIQQPGVDGFATTILVEHPTE